MTAGMLAVRWVQAHRYPRIPTVDSKRRKGPDRASEPSLPSHPAGL